VHDNCQPESTAEQGWTTGRMREADAGYRARPQRALAPVRG
jgi:hypothetical protein